MSVQCNARMTGVWKVLRTAHLMVFGYMRYKLEIQVMFQVKECGCY